MVKARARQEPNDKDIEAFANRVDMETVRPDETAPKTITIRYPDAELPTTLKAVAEGERRSLNSTALLALEIGLKQMQKELIMRSL